MRLSPALAALILVACALAGSARGQTALRVAGASPLVQPFSDAAALLLTQQIELKVIGNSTSAAAISGLGTNQCDLAVATRPVMAAERAAFPELQLAETIIGYQALVPTVSNDVWAGGVRSISRTEFQKIYETKITNWSALHGPNHQIKFFNPEKGKGVWEFFVTWLYADMRKAPLGAQFETVDTLEETRNVVEFNGGSMALLPPSRADSKGTHGLAIREEDGTQVAPTAANVRSGKYPIVRPVTVVTAYKPAGYYRKAVEFMLSKQGQEMVGRADIVPVTEEETE